MECWPAWKSDRGVLGAAVLHSTRLYSTLTIVPSPPFHRVQRSTWVRLEERKIRLERCSMKWHGVRRPASQPTRQRSRLTALRQHSTVVRCSKIASKVLAIRRAVVQLRNQSAAGAVWVGGSNFHSLAPEVTKVDKQVARKGTVRRRTGGEQQCWVGCSWWVASCDLTHRCEAGAGELGAALGLCSDTTRRGPPALLLRPSLVWSVRHWGVTHLSALHLYPRTSTSTSSARRALRFLHSLQASHTACSPHSLCCSSPTQSRTQPFVQTVIPSAVLIEFAFPT